MTTDPETIRRWSEERGVIPVRHRETSTADPRLELVEQSSRTDRHEELEWDRFHDELGQSDRVVVYHEDTGSFDVLDRDEALHRASLESAEVESALLEGETVTSEITETTVIQRTAVEEATVESEIVDRETVESEIIDAELLTREVSDCNVTGMDARDDEMLDYGQFEPGHRFSEELDVEVDVTETWSVTREDLDRLLIESEVVEADETETDVAEADQIEERIEMEGVQQTILESNLLDTNAEPASAIESGSIESEFTEGNRIETQLLERRTTEEEMTVEKTFSGQLTEGETLTVETITSETVESELGEGTLGEGAMGGTAGTAAVSGAMTEDVEGQVTPTENDAGKRVVDARGEAVGEVTRVEGTTLYVDPHPSLTDKVMRALDWGSDEDVYSVDATEVKRITDDRVELATEENV